MFFCAVGSWSGFGSWLGFSSSVLLSGFLGCCCLGLLWLKRLFSSLITAVKLFQIHFKKRSKNFRKRIRYLVNQRAIIAKTTQKIIFTGFFTWAGKKFHASLPYSWASFKWFSASFFKFSISASLFFRSLSAWSFWAWALSRSAWSSLVKSLIIW